MNAVAPPKIHRREVADQLYTFTHALDNDLPKEARVVQALFFAFSARLPKYLCDLVSPDAPQYIR